MFNAWAADLCNVNFIIIELNRNPKLEKLECLI